MTDQPAASVTGPAPPPPRPYRGRTTAGVCPGNGGSSRWRNPASRHRSARAARPRCSLTTGRRAREDVVHPLGLTCPPHRWNRPCGFVRLTLAGSDRRKGPDEREGAHVRRVRDGHRGPRRLRVEAEAARRATPPRRTQPARREARIRRARRARSTTPTASGATPSATNTFPACTSRQRRSVRCSPRSSARWRRTPTPTRPPPTWRTTPPRPCQPERRCTRSRGSRRSAASRRTSPASRVPTSP